MMTKNWDNFLQQKQLSNKFRARNKFDHHLRYLRHSPTMGCAPSEIADPPRVDQTHLSHYPSDEVRWLFVSLSDMLCVCMYVCMYVCMSLHGQMSLTVLCPCFNPADEVLDERWDRRKCHSRCGNRGRIACRIRTNDCFAIIPGSPHWQREHYYSSPGTSPSSAIECRQVRLFCCWSVRCGVVFVLICLFGWFDFGIKILA